jgi:hypothetical protein
MGLFDPEYLGDAYLEVQVWVGDKAHPGCLARRVVDAGGTLDENLVDLDATLQDNYIPVASPRVSLRLGAELRRHGKIVSRELASHDAGSAAKDVSVDAPHFIGKNSSYLLGPLPAAVLEELLLPGEFHVSFDVYYREVFDLILQEWLKDDPAATLATGAADGPVVRSVMSDEDLAKKDKTQFSIQYRERVATLGGVRGVIDGSPVLKPAEPVPFGGTAKLPVVAATVRLELGALHELGLRQLMAAVWSSESDQTEPPGLFEPGQTGRIFALARYLAFRLKPSRGEAIMQSLFDEVKSETDTATLVQNLRLGIDRFLIASNHWAQRRETVRDGEVYQARMSNVFGALLASTTTASPVYVLRTLFRSEAPTVSIPPTFMTEVFVACGVAHCGEHALVAHTLLMRIVDLGGSAVLNSFLCSNANVDHAFCLINFFPDALIRATIQNPRNKGRIGDEIEVVDLRASFNVDTANRKSPILDAYLSPAAGPRTAVSLLAALERKSKRTDIRTHYIEVRDIHPVPDSPAPGAPRPRRTDSRAEKLRNI